VDEVILEEILGRVEHRVIELWDGLVSLGRGPFEKLFEHLECGRQNKARDRVGGRGTTTTREGGWDRGDYLYQESQPGIGGHIV
jgi:hypothetical protein